MSDYTYQLRYQNRLSVKRFGELAARLFELWLELGVLDVRGLKAAEEAYWEVVDRGVEVPE